MQDSMILSGDHIMTIMHTDHLVMDILTVIHIITPGDGTLDGAGDTDMVIDPIIPIITMDTGITILLTTIVT